MFRADQRKYPKKHTAAWRLFHYQYRVYYPSLFNYDTTYLETRGMIMSGDSRLDQERLTTPELQRQCPAGMAMLMAEGAPITVDAFFDIDDIPYVYYDLQEHFQDWEKALNQGIHFNLLPDLEEFRQLEVLAVELHGMAHALTEAPPNATGLLGRLQRLNQGRANRLSTQHLNDINEAVPYVSIVERIEHLALRGNAWQ